MGGLISSLQLGILRLVNHTHSAPTEPFEHAVVRNHLADEFSLTSHSRECYGDACQGSTGMAFGKAFVAKMFECYGIEHENTGRKSGWLEN
jgi:hypothetical protein